MTIYDDERDARQTGGRSGAAVAALVLGIVNLFAWCLPICGLPLAIAGIVCGVLGLKSENPGMAIAGLVMSGLGLIAGIVNGAIGAYLGATGQHPLLQ